MKLWLEIDKLFKNLLGRNVLKGNLDFWKYIDFSDEMGIDKKLKATCKVKHSTNNLAKNYEVPITNEQLSIFNLICNFLLISACRLATSTDSFTGASQKFPFFFFFQNRHLLEDFKKAPSDTVGLSPKEIYLVTVVRVSNYGNSIGIFCKSPFKNNLN